MMKNFGIVDAIAIQVGSIYADLHNDFDLASLEIDYTEKVLQLVFKKTLRVGSQNTCCRLTLSFFGLDYLSMSAGALGTIARDTVEIGYKGPTDFDHDWLISEGQANTQDHFFLRLAGDEFIRVHGASSAAHCDIPFLN